MLAMRPVAQRSTSVGSRRSKQLNLKIQLPRKSNLVNQSFPVSIPTQNPEFVGIATEIVPNVFVGDLSVARNDTLMEKIGITHIINCVGQNYPNYFPLHFEYMQIEMKDNPSEDIFCLFYDAIDFIEKAIRNGKVLIHCKCGISRSTAICIAYIIYKQHCSYRKAFEILHRSRPVSSPNAGFIIALQSWQSHLNGEPLKSPRLYKMEAGKGKAQVASCQLTPQSCFILHTNQSLHLWSGKETEKDTLDLAQRFVSQLQKYEKAPGVVISETQGSESESFKDALSKLNPEYRT